MTTRASHCAILYCVSSAYYFHSFVGPYAVLAYELSRLLPKKVKEQDLSQSRLVHHVLTSHIPTHETILNGSEE